MQRSSIAIAVLLSCVAATSPTRAYACSCLEKPIYDSQPVDGSKNVPQDIVPVFEGAFEPTAVSLQDEHGAKLTFLLNVVRRPGCLGDWAELLSVQPLAANTRYTIRVGALHPEALDADLREASISFTTGSDELADLALAPPKLAAASVLRGAPDCGGLPAITVCIGGLEEPSPTDLELTARRGNKVLLRLTSLIHDDGSYGIEEQPDCIELRRRAVDGRRSEPAKICGDALLARDYRASDSTQSGWVGCKDGILGDRDAYNEKLDAGAATEPARDGSASDAANPTPSDSGCNVVAAAQSDLPRALPFVLGCALLLRASARRKRVSSCSAL